MSYTPLAPITPFWGWTAYTPALPNFYWDVYSAEQRIKKICSELYKMCEYANMLCDSINVDRTAIKELQDALSNIDDIDELIALVQQIQETLDELPDYSEFTTLQSDVDNLEEELEQQVAALNAAISNASTQLHNEITTETNNRQTADTNLQTEMAARDTTVLNSAKSYSDVSIGFGRYRNGTMLCIGDSWNAGVYDLNYQTSDYSLDDGWGAKLMSLLHIKNRYTYGLPSTGLIAASQNRTFMTMAQQAANDITDPDTVNIIVIGGGVNDANMINAETTTKAAIVTAARALAQYLRETFINADVYVFPMLWPGHSPVRWADIITKEAYIEGFSGAYACAICDHAPEWLYGDSTYFGLGTQGHHTTKNGLILTARRMAQFIMCGNAHPYRYIDLVGNAQTDNLDVQNGQIIIKDGTLLLHVRGNTRNRLAIANNPLITVPNGDTWLPPAILQMFLVSAISGGNPPIQCTATGGTINFASQLSATDLDPEKAVYLYMSTPFAF